MGSTNINNYEYEGFIEADEENEFNIYFQRNEHEEHEVEVLSEDLEVIDSRRQSAASMRNNNNNQNDSNPFPPPPSFHPLVHTHSLHDAIIKLPHELGLLSNLTPISIFMQMKYLVNLLKQEETGIH
nr:11065_t:CDS:1 [Entrophospora candida]